MDYFIAVKIKTVATVEGFSFTREDVVKKLMEFAASAAAVFGPYSDEVADLEGDIQAVKYDNASLADFTWCFPQMAAFEKEIAE